MNKKLQNDTSFSLKVQMVQAKMNLCLSLPVCSIISMRNIKDENIINNQKLSCAAYSNNELKMTMTNISTRGGITSLTIPPSTYLCKKG